MAFSLDLSRYLQLIKIADGSRRLSNGAMSEESARGEKNTMKPRTIPEKTIQITKTAICELSIFVTRGANHEQGVSKEIQP